MADTLPAPGSRMERRIAAFLEGLRDVGVPALSRSAIAQGCGLDEAQAWYWLDLLAKQGYVATADEVYTSTGRWDPSEASPAA